MWLAAAVTYCNAPSLHYVTCHVSGVTRVRVPGPDTDWQLLGIRTGTGYCWVRWSCGINNSRQILWLVSVAECWLSPDASNYDDHSLHHALPLTLHITVIKILVSRPHLSTDLGRVLAGEGSVVQIQIFTWLNQTPSLHCHTTDPVSLYPNLCPDYFDIREQRAKIWF